MDDAIDRSAFQQQPDMGRKVGVAEPGQPAAARPSSALPCAWVYMIAAGCTVTAETWGKSRNTSRAAAKCDGFEKRTLPRRSTCPRRTADILARHHFFGHGRVDPGHVGATVPAYENRILNRAKAPSSGQRATSLLATKQGVSRLANARMSLQET